jgi:hypothetical protein
MSGCPNKVYFDRLSIKTNHLSGDENSGTLSSVGANCYGNALKVWGKRAFNFL